MEYRTFITKGSTSQGTALFVYSPALALGSLSSVALSSMQALRIYHPLARGTFLMG